MHCKNCFAPLSEEDAYCKVCGKTVEKEETSAYPSNEEIIASYKEETEPLIPSEQAIQEMSEIKPVQTLEPEIVEVETKVDPFVVNVEEKKEEPQQVKEENAENKPEENKPAEEAPVEENKPAEETPAA